MWELICHHTYKWQGLPVDLSPYGSDGVERGVEFLPDGASPGSGALHFPYNASVSIARSDAWSPLGAVRVEAIVRYNGELSHVQPILDADNSFTFEANDGFLFALVWDKHPSQPGAEHVNLNTRDHGLSSPGYRLPLNQWTRVRLRA